MTRLIPIALIAGVAITLPGPDANAQTADEITPPSAKRAHHHRGSDRQRGGMFRAFMERYDTNADGSLTREEVLAARAAQFGTHDGDGNGTLSLDEYQALWLEVMRERMVDRFQDHDDDGNGAVTLDEFNEDITRMLDRADRNDDGVINQDDMRRRGGQRGDQDRRDRGGPGAGDRDGNE